MALGSAVSMILQRRAVYSALSLIICLCSLAALFVQLSAPFLAIIQIIVYAGAIMVLFLFVIMLLDPQADVMEGDKIKYLTYVTAPLAAAMVLILLRGSNLNEIPTRGSAVGTTERIGEALFTDFLLPFEVTSILILVAIVGAVILAKRRI